MAPPRIEIPHSIYHVNAKAVHGTKLFVDDVDRLAFLELLSREAAESKWQLLAYSLMTTHYHLLLRIEKRSLSSGFQRLGSVYARRYNERHERRGALWQRRFFDAMVLSDDHLYEAIRYIARNAPKANVCPRPEDWPWCSYGAAVGAYPPDPLVDEPALLSLFGTSPAKARRRLQAFVEETDPRVRRGQTSL
ncbi:MAG TPA: transposase [Gaiellaceae bacterium]|jgi:REP element-mobilizing transposase RayT